MERARENGHKKGAGELREASDQSHPFYNLASTLQSAGRQAGDLAKSVVSEVKSAGSHSLDVWGDEGKKYVETVRTYVKQNPAKGLIFAFAAGFAINRLFSKGK